MCMSLQRIDITYLGKKLFFKFLGTNCVMPKSGHQGVKTAGFRASTKNYFCGTTMPPSSQSM